MGAITLLLTPDHEVRGDVWKLCWSCSWQQCAPFWVMPGGINADRLDLRDCDPTSFGLAACGCLVAMLQSLLESLHVGRHLFAGLRLHGERNNEPAKPVTGEVDLDRHT